MDLSHKAAIVGVAESDEIGHVPDKSSLQHHTEASYNALQDAGLDFKDVDAIFCARPSAYELAEYLGIIPRFTDGTAVGGSSFVIHVGHAVAAITTGLIDVALISHGEAGRSAKAPRVFDANMPESQYERPYGSISAPSRYALACSRYMYLYGEDRTRKALSEIAVATRRWAQLNPKAFMRDPMTFDDYHNSRWIAWPFHLLDCCLVTDGGGACVLVSERVAKQCAKAPVWVQGFAEGHDHMLISQMPNLTKTIASQTGQRAMEMAGVEHGDIDLIMAYDSFTYTVLVTLESLGFCAPGEGPDLVANQRTGPGGDFPINSNGGGLSYTHTGMYGMFLLLEAVRQIRGECGPRQVPNCNTVLVNGTGGALSSCGTIVVTSD